MWIVTENKIEMNKEKQKKRFHLVIEKLKIKTPNFYQGLISMDIVTGCVFAVF